MTRLFSALSGYILAVLTVSGALLVSWVTPLNDFSPTALFFAAVMVSSWYGGLWAGLLATALSAVAIDVFIVPPSFALFLDWGDVVRVGVFVLEAVLISWLNDRRKRLEASLRQRNEELEAAHRRKDNFLAALGHELRSPLAPVCNSLPILRTRCRGDAALAEVCAAVERQARHMTRLVDDLLDVSRIAQGKVVLHPEPVDLGAIVAHAVETCRPLLTARRHELQVELPPQPVWLRADPTRLGQVLVNLLTNAARHSDSGGRVWLTAAREGREVALRVRDTGVGIAPDLLPRIFDLYTQGEAARATAGLGIGLSLVRSLVLLHGGSVTAHSDGPGRGSEFVVRLPALDGPPADAPSPAEAPGAGGPLLRILIVDDNGDGARLLAMLLEMWGHEVRTAPDGPAALAEVPSFEPQVVLLDIHLPGLDGYEVARRIRRLPLGGERYLIALTGYGQEEDLRRSRAAGFDHHLVKPVNVAELEQLLGRCATAAVWAPAR